MAVPLWLARYEEHVRQVRLLARIALETGNDMPPASKGRVSSDEAAMRGIPVVGRRGSYGGAIRGTRPGDGLR